MTDGRTTKEKLDAEADIEMRVEAARAQGYAAGMARMSTLDAQRAPAAERVTEVLNATIILLEAMKVPAASAAAVILRELVADI